MRVLAQTAAVDEHGRKPGALIITAPMPKELFKRGLLAPSMIAHILVQKFRFGIPFHRLSEMLRAQGVDVDDSVICRYAEDAGNTLACIVDVAAKEAKEAAFCLSTDATGVCIQPEQTKGGSGRACRKGHFFVVLADQDHVFFEYQPKHTSAAVCEMFRGFKGYIQADAHCVYDALYRGDARVSPDDRLPRRSGAGAMRGGGSGRPPPPRNIRRRARRCFGSTSSSSSRASGLISLRSAATIAGNSPRARSWTTSSRGRRTSTSA